MKLRLFKVISGCLPFIFITQIHAVPTLNFCYDKLTGAKRKKVIVGSKTYDISFKGTLCAIKPSVTAKKGEAIKDKGATQLGFGYHVIGVPDNLNSNTPVWIHFTGTSGRPFSQSARKNLNGDKKLGEFGTSVFLGEIVKKGFLVLQLAYSNDKSVNQEICKPDAKNKTTDWCSARAREEILLGYNAHDAINVTKADSFINRFERLVQFLKSKNFPLPRSIRPENMDYKNWTMFKDYMVSGHSQGGGHAFYIAKYVETKGACALAGGFDRYDQQNPINSFSDWMNDPYKMRTPSRDMGAFVVKGDDSYDSFVKGYEEIFGLSKGVDYFTAGQKDYHDDFGNSIVDPKTGEKEHSHGAVLKAVELQGKRSQACFKAAGNL